METSGANWGELVLTLQRFYGLETPTHEDTNEPPGIRRVSCCLPLIRDLIVTTVSAPPPHLFVWLSPHARLEHVECYR